jgi:glutamyl-tRNA reductase
MARTIEIARARKLLAKGENVDAVLEALSRGLTQKMLHGTMAELRSGDAAGPQQTSTAVSTSSCAKNVSSSALARAATDPAAALPAPAYTR